MIPIDDINWKYTPAAKTNLLETFKRLGFEPPTEDKRFQEKFNTYKHLLWRNEQ
jgi:hypothetical protein